MTKNKTSLFSYHLELFSRFSKELVEPLKTVTTEGYSYSRTKKSELNLLKNGSFAFHSEEGALHEASKALESAIVSGRPKIAIYGLGLGYFYDILKGWISDSPSRFVVFIEDDLVAIKMFLQTERAVELLKDAQVAIAYLGPLDPLDPFLSRLEATKSIWVRLGSDFSFVILPSYRVQKSSIPILCAHLLRYTYSLDAYLVPIFQNDLETNFYYNLLHLHEMFSTKGLFENFPKVPFIICGAGPSISQEIDLLREISEETLLIGSGTGMNVLSSHAIEASLGVAYDQNLGGADRLKANNAFLTPFFVDLNCSPEGANALHGPMLLTIGLQKGWRNEILDQLDLLKDCIQFRAIVSSTYYAFQVGAGLNASPIVFVGVDLAFQEDRQYATSSNWFKAEDISGREDKFIVVTEDQRTVVTSPIFYAEAFALGARIAECKDIECYYASAKGQGISGAKTIDLHDFWNSVSHPQIDLENALHTAIFLQPKIYCPDLLLKKVLLDWQKKLCSNDAKDFFAVYEVRIDLLHAFERQFLDVLKNELPPEVYLKKTADLDLSRASFMEKILQTHLSAIDDVLEEINGRDLSSSRSTSLFGKVEVRQSFKCGKLEGVSQFFSQEGTLMAEGNYLEGKREGVLRQYYQSKALYCKQEWREGLKEGVDEYFYETGSVSATIPYHKGLIDGTVILYYPNGIIKNQSEFKQGLRNGPMRLYSKNGKLLEEGFYKEGIPVGIYQKWGRKGGLEKKLFYRGEGSYDLLEWDAKGQLIKEIKSLQNDPFAEVKIIGESIERLLNETL